MRARPGWLPGPRVLGPRLDGRAREPAGACLPEPLFLPLWRGTPGCEEAISQHVCAPVTSLCCFVLTVTPPACSELPLGLSPCLRGLQSRGLAEMKTPCKSPILWATCGTALAACDRSGGLKLSGNSYLVTVTFLPFNVSLEKGRCKWRSSLLEGLWRVRGPRAEARCQSCDLAASSLVSQSDPSQASASAVPLPIASATSR